jgi:SAM-dependent methyltransferase
VLDGRALEQPEALPAAEPWRDELGRLLFPLPFPDLIVDEGVFVPTHGSYLVWKYLFLTGAGEGRTCLDIGCGSGILTVQLAANGAERVHAIDIDRKAVANTLANAYRLGYGDGVTVEEVDLYAWEPSDRFDLVVASLYQMPVDPFEEPTGHRPLDYWGRNLLDHFLRLLPRLLSENGRALVMQLSIVGQTQTAKLLAEGKLNARVVDFSFLPLAPLFAQNWEQIERVEQLSDAYHLRVADDDVIIAYLLEVTRDEAARDGHQQSGQRES